MFIVSDIWIFLLSFLFLFYTHHQINLPEDKEVGCVDSEDMERVSV